VQRHPFLNFPKHLRRDYTAELHELHWTWYLNSRLTDIAREKATRAALAQQRSLATQQAKERAVKRAAMEAASKGPHMMDVGTPQLCQSSIMDGDSDGDDEDSDDSSRAAAQAEDEAAAEAAQLQILYPIQSKEAFLVKSKDQYLNYITACKHTATTYKDDGHGGVVAEGNDTVPWHDLYPQVKYHIPNLDANPVAAPAAGVPPAAHRPQCFGLPWYGTSTYPPSGSS
jgi:hypothetical protein